MPRKMLIVLIVSIGLGVLVGLTALAAGGAWWFRHELVRLQVDAPPYAHDVGEVRGERVAMRDGVHLATRILIPEGDAEAWPTVLIRDPYQIPDLVTCDVLVRFGYACVHQIARGRFESEGDWTPLVNEREDGLDTLAWLTAQPWQDGNIALYGLSYLAMVQWSVADALPPEVKTIVPHVYATDSRGVMVERGMFRHEVWTAWAAAMPGREFLLGRNEEYQQAIRHRPHDEADERFLGGVLPWYRLWVSAADAKAAVWNEPAYAALREVPPRVRAPVLSFGGWHDLFVESQLEDFHRLGSRSRSKLVIGAWGHTLQPWGDLAAESGIDGNSGWDLILDWLGHHLRDEPLAQQTGVVQTYTIGEEVWREQRDWLPPTTPRRFYLSEAAAATACDGGRLGDSPSDDLESVSCRYDPLDPVPTRGGAGLLAYLIPGIDGAPAAAVEQAGLCDRADVLSFVSAPFDEAWTIAGPSEVSLSVSPDAPDTAFTAKLIEVRRDGSAFNIRDGITSLAYRDGDGDDALAYAPGQIVEATIDLWPIEWQLAAGSRLRVDISSSNFPAYHAHPNLAGPWASIAETAVAQQTLHLGGSNAGSIEVPVRTH